MQRMTPKELEEYKGRAARVLMRHVGPGEKISMPDLYEKVFDEKCEHRINGTKRLRKVVTALREEGERICSSTSTANGGYWLAASASELNDYCQRKTRGHLKGLAQVARLKRIGLPELLGQMQMEIEPPAAPEEGGHA